MHSSELAEYGFKKWFKIKPRDYDGNKKLVLSLPRKKVSTLFVKATELFQELKENLTLSILGKELFRAEFKRF